MGIGHGGARGAWHGIGSRRGLSRSRFRTGGTRSADSDDMPPSSAATTSPAPDTAFSERMAKPRSPEVPVTESMRQRILARTAAWLGASGVTQIALFGAGRHSRPIIRQPWHAHSIRGALVLDDNPRLPSIGGVPVVRPGEAPLPT
ncbi:MAG: hypothetical protein ACK58T_14410, partial [Phycisphaerae bacterium]